jgi:predicted protein tyrosine phosphatase
MKKVLFVCSSNKQRSPTAEDHFSAQYPHMEFESAGTNQKFCQKEGTAPLTEDLMRWADMVIVMENHHRNLIRKHVKDKYDHKIKVLDIKDIYAYGQSDLIEILDEKVSKFLNE